MKTKIEPPEGLSKKSQALWTKIVSKRAFKSAGRLQALEQALRCLDRADQARAEITRDGLCTETKTTGAIHSHPALRIEKDNLSMFARIWKELNLYWSYDEDSH